LRRQGATVLYAGGVKPLNSFYLGLYGGSEIPGVLASDNALQQACRRSNYREVDRVQIMQVDVGQFRSPVTRELRTIRRTTNIVETLDPPANNWWEACVWGSQQRIRFRLIDKYRQAEVASASLWDVQPLSACWGYCTAGMFELYVDAEHRRRGYATYLVSETIRQLRQRGVRTIEAQTMSVNMPAQAFYQKLGFSCVDEGVVFRKESTFNGSS
jgi:ribosomal protein S18 acetylase RimI-like enzyme